VPPKPSLPPPELMQRVGRIEDPDIAAAYDAIGRHSRLRVERLLPADWSWDGKRVLDFGCGAGRTLRHFLDEAEQGEFHGCDIDSRSIAWLGEHLSPPLQVFQNCEAPELPRPDGFFDLAYALSVFTHLSEDWAGWMLELHRVLKPGGLLLATFLNEAHWEIYGRGKWDEARVGMNVIRKWNPWEDGGPIVFHSEWWIREHWGRAFDVLLVERHDPAEAPKGQGAAFLRRRPGLLERADLERAGDDPRELAAARHNVEQLHEEAAGLFTEFSRASESHEALAQKLQGVQTELERLRAELAEISRSRSWRLTAPLRAATAVLRKRST
jgi:SAM-dependent methyltransferase